MKFLYLVLFSSVTLQVFAQDATAIRKKHFNTEKNIAIAGYDPVAYFTDHKAVKGNASFALSYEGIVYHFSSDAHKELFRKNPSAYEPQYGGWCAYAMGSTGEKVEIDPETFKIINGKLFLFYNKRLNNTLNTWNKDQDNLHKKADANWVKVYKP